MGTSRIRGLWLGYGVLSLVLAAAPLIAPADSPAANLTTYAYPLIAIVAVGVGIRLNRPARTLPWLLLMATLITGIVGNILLRFYLARGDLPFPSLADLFWLLSSPIELVALMLLIDGVSWRRDRAGILDTLMVSGGLGLGVWLLFVRDLVAPGLPLDAQLVSAAYPLADLLLLTGVIRMFTSSAHRNAAFWLLAGSLALQGGADAVWVWQSSHGVTDNKLAPLFVLSALLLGGAALHPSMGRIGGAVSRPGSVITSRRVLLIGSACLLSPVLLIIDGTVGHGRVDWLAAAVCTILVFLLLIARFTGLMRTVQDQAGQLESIAYLDGLTGIPNRRAWDTELDRRLAATRRAGGTLVVGLMDLDHFKRYNDEHGHQAGDELLRAATGGWQQQLRAEDLIARYGGEEFGLVLQGRLRDAAVVLERLREVTPEGQTFSAGLAQWTGEESAAQLVARADDALYAAKRQGRDQYSISGDPARTDLHADLLSGTVTPRI